MAGYGLGPIEWWTRALLAIGAVAFMLPNTAATFIGLGLVAMGILWHITKVKRLATLEAITADSPRDKPFK